MGLDCIFNLFFSNGTGNDSSLNCNRNIKSKICKMAEEDRIKNEHYNKHGFDTRRELDLL